MDYDSLASIDVIDSHTRAREISLSKISNKKKLVDTGLLELQDEVEADIKKLDEINSEIHKYEGLIRDQYNMAKAPIHEAESSVCVPLVMFVASLFPLMFLFTMIR